MKPEPQDYINALEAQRNDAANHVANLVAENASLKRHVSELESEINTLREEVRCGVEAVEES